MSKRTSLHRSQRLALVGALLAATALVAHARGLLPEPVPPAPAPAPARAAAIEAVFVLDTTGSMSGLIEGAKQKIWSIANEMANASQETTIRMGLIGYRDRGDAYVTRRFDLTDDLDALYGHLFELRADGGGDTPESVNQALHEAITGMGWSRGENVYRVVFLVGDAPPHTDYQDDVSWSESVRLAAQHDIVVNTVQCGGMAETTTVWRQIAAGAQGSFAAIAQDGAMVAVRTPVDDELVRLNRELGATILPYGDEADRMEIAEKKARSLAAPAPAAAARLSYLAKRGGRANLGRMDLLDALGSGSVADVASVPEAELPGELRALEPEAREAFAREQLAKREVLKDQIADLSRERDDYVREETARLAAEGKGDGFDQKVLEAVRSQARAKGIEYGAE